MPRRKVKKLEKGFISASVDEWYCNYSLNVFTPSKSKYEPLIMLHNAREFEEYDEHISIEIIGTVLEDMPNLKIFKGNVFKLSMYFFYDLDKYPFSAKGSIGMIEKNSLGEYYAHVKPPKNSASYILNVLSSGKVKELQLLMTQLYYRKAELISCSLTSNPDYLYHP